uniref:Uncharacterized protein n=1 Tax=Arundo donax TaxID=35708 RepID=A0A0A9GMG7_ARUDO
MIYVFHIKKNEADYIVACFLEN